MTEKKLEMFFEGNDITTTEGPGCYRHTAKASDLKFPVRQEDWPQEFLVHRTEWGEVLVHKTNSPVGRPGIEYEGDDYTVTVYDDREEYNRRGVILRDALNNYIPTSGAADDYCKGLVVGVMAGLLANGHSWNVAIGMVREVMPKDRRPLTAENVPECWLPAFEG